MEIQRRPVRDEDEPFLLALYGSTREDELALTDWDAAQKKAFVTQQYEAQKHHYVEHYPGATHDLVLVDGEPAGRLWLARWPAEIRVMDIAVGPEFRDRGVGTQLLRNVQAEAAASGLAVTIHVERFNRARQLYERLGFVVVKQEGDVYLLMRWTPADS